MLNFSFGSPMKLRFYPLSSLGLLALAAILSSHGPTLVSASSAPRPNIILVMADDLGWGDVSYNSNTVTYADGTAHPDRGWIQTPTMDLMAANGLRFDRFYSASAVCSPTRFSCLTGRNPNRGGIGGANTGRLNFDETALSEVLSSAGYATAHLGKWHLGIMTTERLDGNEGGKVENVGRYSAPWHHGYDTVFATESKVPTYNPYGNDDYDGVMAIEDLPNLYNVDSDHNGTRYWELPYTGDQLTGEGTVVVPDALFEIATNYTNQAEDYDGDDSQILVNRAIPFMQDAVANNQPFFLVLWFHTPHKPVKDRDNPSASANSQAALKNSVEDMDAALGRLRSELDTLGVRNNTMLWMTSDNGPENGIDSPTDETNNEPSKTYQRPLRAGRYLDRKGSLYEGGIIVPGILEWPDVISTGASTDMPVVTSDYYPTILDYLQLTVAGQKPLDGISLRPVIEGTSHTRSKPIIFKLGNDTALTTDQYKLIDQNIGNAVSGELRLYDMVNIGAGEEPEQTPLATASDYTAKSQTIQDLYTSLKAEHDALLTSINNDTNYVHGSQPTVTLSTDSNTVTTPFTVTATFSESVSQLHAHEFVVTNSTASNLSGSGTTYTLLITPEATGTVTIDLPAAAAIDVDGNINPSSNQLSIEYTGSQPDDPAVTLSTPANPATAAFTVSVKFTEAINGLSLGDFAVTNGNASNLAGSDADYTVLITPTAAGDVTVNLPENTVNAVDDNAGNAASNSLITNYAPDPGGNSSETIETNLVVNSGQTVDSNDDVPGNGSNNLEKFSPDDGAPYTSAVYVRSGSNSARRVQAFLEFDLSNLPDEPVSSATLQFNAYSLNGSTSVDLQVVALAADWSAGGTPSPTYTHATVGSVINAGDISSGRDGSGTKDYSIDLTTAVQNWQSGTWPNYGIRLQLSDDTANNGLGIQPSGDGSIKLVIEQAPLAMTQSQIVPDSDDVILQWSSNAALTYGVQATNDLTDTWQLLLTVPGNASGTNSVTLTNAMDGFEQRFFRVIAPVSE